MDILKYVLIVAAGGLICYFYKILYNILCILLEIKKKQEVDSKGKDGNETIIVENSNEEKLRQIGLNTIKKEEKMPGDIRVNNTGTGLVTSGKDYIPYGLNEQDKAILRMFNDNGS